MAPSGNMTYAKAGVSIEAGDELVRRIGPIASRTKKPGVLAGVGGFSALFDLKSRGYRHPVLVSSTDGVGTKLKVAFMMKKHDTIGIDPLVELRRCGRSGDKQHTKEGRQTDEPNRGWHARAHRLAQRRLYCASKYCHCPADVQHRPPPARRTRRAAHRGNAAADFR